MKIVCCMAGFGRKGLEWGGFDNGSSWLALAMLIAVPPWHLVFLKVTAIKFSLTWQLSVAWLDCNSSGVHAVWHAPL